MKTAIYSRVSTELQNARMQTEQLTRFAEAREWQSFIYSETGSGADANRPVLAQLIVDARKRKFDTVLVWRLDRLARSLKELIDLVELFKSLGIEFISHQESIDTTTPGGRLVFHIFGAIAEFERSLIGERVKAGMEEAKRRGKRLGRPPVPKNAVRYVLFLRKKKYSYKQIQDQFNKVGFTWGGKDKVTRQMVAGIARRGICR